MIELDDMIVAPQPPIAEFVEAPIVLELPQIADAPISGEWIAKVTELCEQYDGLLTVFLRKFDSIDAATIEDIKQDVWLKVTRYGGSKYEETGSAAGWLRTIAHNTLMDHYRKSKRKAETNQVEVDKAEETGVIAAKDSTLDNPVETCLKRLENNETYRAILGKMDPKFLRALLLAAEGYKYDEIAEIENVAVGTVRSRIYRARQIAYTALGTTQTI